MRKINVSEAVLHGRETEYVERCLHAGRLSMGYFVRQFEDRFAKFCGMSHALTCSSGTAALHLAVKALGLRYVDEKQYVIIPALTYIATANAVAYCGGVPVCCDVNPRSWVMTGATLESKLIELKAVGIHPVGVIPVHLYGVPCEMDAIMKIAEREDMWVVEDAAQAHGGICAGKRLGSFGDIGTFSFYGNKIITAGEGGAVVTSDAKLQKRMMLLRGQGQTAEYTHTVLGYNYRMTDMQAAVVLAQLEDFTWHREQRRRVVQTYQTELKSFETQYRPEGSADWMFSILVPKGASRDKVRELLHNSGIETRPVFPQINAQPLYNSSRLPVAEDIASRGINLPTHAMLEEEELAYICNAVQEAVHVCA